MPLSSSVKSSVAKKLEEYEGRHPHLYLDSKGLVTIGIGHFIPNKNELSSVPLYTVKNNIPFTLASQQKKLEEYTIISQKPKNYKASWYRQFCTLVMKDSDINLQRDKHLNTFYSELVSIYNIPNGYKRNFDDYPEVVQKALFDMIFNLGQTKLRNIFVNFNAAIKQENWNDAALESNRPDVNSARNLYVRELLIQASNIPKTNQEVHQ